MSHEHGHVELTAYLEQVLADVAIRKGQLSLAADRLHRARSAHEKTGSLDGLAEALRSTGDLAAADGRWADAITWLCHALDIWRRVESRIEIARTLARLERAHTAAGAHQAARSWRRECQTILADLALDDACLYLPPFYLR